MTEPQLAGEIIFSVISTEIPAVRTADYFKGKIRREREREDSTSRTIFLDENLFCGRVSH